MKDWSKKELKLLRKHYPTMPTEQLAKLLKRTISGVKSKANKLGISKRIASNNPYTPKLKAKLFNLYPNTRNEDLAKILGVSVGSVISAGYRYRLRKTAEFMRKHSEKGMFKPGREPKNKGKRLEDYLDRATILKIKKTSFKKGNKPATFKPVGSERINQEGYTEVKVRNPKSWKLKHRVIYEKNFGKIPKGCNVQFKDRNSQNFDPSNLVLRTRKENMEINSVHSLPPEIEKAIQMIGALNRQINKRK
jgi:hypothetical protein